VVCEVDPVRALEARMEGYRVMSTHEAASVGNIFVTATGDINALGMDAFERMKDGAILANTGHFNVEIDVQDLEKIARAKKVVRENVVEYSLRPDKRLNLIAEGRLVNLAAAEGHPSAVMDMSFANQSLSAEYLWKKRGTLSPKVYHVPQEIDERIAALKLKAMGVGIDTLTAKQERYLLSWREGT